MAKSLKTSVQLDTSKAVRSLGALEKKIQSVQATIDKQNKVINKVNNTYNKVNTSANKATASISKNSIAMTQNGKSATLLTTKLKRLASAYLGVMGAKAAISTANTIQSAENRLNAYNGNNESATQLSMDKMYVASQNSNMRYSDMLANASKSMTLAGEAFQGNIDNAIRFQEIMAKSYTLGGASAAEQSSSMYQMIQALGSGTLQGDELRSVREGAPLAYKKIEEFAQGVYNTTDSLKEMASEGMITSDMVVAAMMNAGESIDLAFEDMDITFGQAFNKIQNIAIKSFEPVIQMLNSALNSTAGESIINGIGWALQFVAGVLRVVFELISSIYTYIVDNWSWISKILTILGVMLGVYLLTQVYALYTAFQALIVKAWTAISTLVVEFITMGKALGYATAMSTLFGVTLNMWAWVLIAILAVVVIAIFLVADSFVDACGIIVGIIFATGAVIYNIVAYLINIVIGLGKIIVDSLSNAWNLALIGFWKFVQGCLSGTSTLAKAVSKIAALFGMDEVYIDSQMSAAEDRLIDVTGNLDDYFNSIEYKDIGDAYDNGYNIGSKVGGLGDWINDKLGLDNLSNITSNTPSVADAYSIPDNLSSIADDTSDISDSLDLTEEDLSYLRDIAEQEWKKEFTTASITVDMSNYNTINGDSDLDGIATRLADKLYEELHSVANGVYV